jgi:hypothetical protein
MTDIREIFIGAAIGFAIGVGLLTAVAFTLVVFSL